MKFFAFRYNKHFDLRPSMCAMIDEHQTIPNLNRYIAYLSNTVNHLNGVMGEIPCLIDSSHIEYGYAYLTDGTWIWTTTMIHYVEHHYLILPEDFRRHIEENNFVMPTLTEDEKDEIGDAYHYIFEYGIEWVPPNGYDESL